MNNLEEPLLKLTEKVIDTRMVHLDDFLKQDNLNNLVMFIDPHFIDFQTCTDIEDTVFCIENYLNQRGIGGILTHIPNTLTDNLKHLVPSKSNIQNSNSEKRKQSLESKIIEMSEEYNSVNEKRESRRKGITMYKKHFTYESEDSNSSKQFISFNLISEVADKVSIVNNSHQCLPILGKFGKSIKAKDMNIEIKNKLLNIRNNVLQRNSYMYDRKDLEILATQGIRNKVASLNLYKKNNSFEIEIKKSKEDLENSHGVESLNLESQVFSNKNSKLVDSLVSECDQMKLSLPDDGYGMIRSRKQVTFDVEEGQFHTSNEDDVSKDSDEEVWFNNEDRQGFIEGFFKDKENILEFIITIYALIEYFNKSHYIKIINYLQNTDKDIVEKEVMKISNELSKQVDINKEDANMAESNYLLVIQRDLENTQIRLEETEKLLKKQQTDYTELEIQTNNLLRRYEDLSKENEVIKKIGQLLEEEIETLNKQFKEERYNHNMKRRKHFLKRTKL